jgi:hypothetical protein
MMEKRWDGPVRFPLSHEIPSCSPTLVPGQPACGPDTARKETRVNMNPIDSAILTSCEGDFRPLKPLLKTMPRGTLYRHVERLTKLGWLVKEGRFYQTTDAGRRQVQTARQGRQWNRFDVLYPPVKHMPTDVHRAVFELSLAAVVCRQSQTRPDRHPFFVCAGGTLRWKSSLGIFLCHALGLDPSAHVVECSAEVGKSLLVRRDAEGTIVYQRELLATPLIVLDEFQAAAPPVRAALAPMLSGRLIVPLENQRLTIHSVPLVLLNPAEKLTLELRLGLSPPLIRRGLIANLDAIVMPDLALIGEQALTAAWAQKPLSVTSPAVDCQPFDQRIIDLCRDILKEEAAERIDLQVVVNLCTGMTAWLPDPTDAIAQVAHGVGLLAETMAWTRGGWIQAAIDFSLKSPARPRTVHPNIEPHIEASAAVDVSQERIDLHIPRLSRETNLPDLSMSDNLKGRLAWLAVETGRPVDEVLKILIDLYVEWRRQPDTVATLTKILELARAQDRLEIDLDALHRYLKAEETLASHRRSFEDVPHALHLIESLAVLPESWTWTMAKSAVGAVAFLIKSGIESSEVENVLRRHQRLNELGFEEAEAEAVAEALVRAGAVGRQRTRLVNRLVAMSGKVINAAELERERGHLEQEVVLLRAEQAQLKGGIKHLRNQLDSLQPTAPGSALIQGEGE